jgi:putative inorganic carbon (HCO3(-)) transporter
MRTLSRLREARRNGAVVDPEIYALAQAVVAALAGFIVSGTFLTQGFTWPIYILIALGVALTHFGERGLLGESGAAPIPDGLPV